MRAHWIDSNESISGEALAAEGVLNRVMQTAPSDYQGPLDALKKAHGYVHQDVIALTPDTPDLDVVCAKFVDEHHHTEDEVRFVLEGTGVFDIRSRDDRWMRVEVTAGDLIVVPRARHHRFFLGDDRTIRCVRLFQDPTGWVAHYRESSDASA